MTLCVLRTHLLSAYGLHVPSHRVLRIRRNGCYQRMSKRTRQPVNASLANAAQAIVQQTVAPIPGVLPAVLANTAVFTLGIRVLLAGLTPLGVANAWLLGTAVFAAFGWSGFSIVCLYFLFGSAVTKIKLAQKQAEGIAEARSGRRSVGSVWGSGSAGFVCAVLALLQPELHLLWQVSFVASFVSKLSDTVSSEIGKAYGETTYLVTTFQRVPRGTEGAVSAEGTFAGCAAAFGFAALAFLFGQVTLTGAAVATAAAIIANLFESYLGAASQGKVGWLTNDVVNGIQIAVAASIAAGTFAVLQNLV